MCVPIVGSCSRSPRCTARCVCWGRAQGLVPRPRNWAFKEYLSRCLQAGWASTGQDEAASSSLSRMHAENPASLLCLHACNNMWCVRSENLFCGKRPDYQMTLCGYFRRDCVKGVGVADYCPAQAPPHPEVYYINGSERAACHP